tara:strand:- start:19 stop:120 length:102 start_codon:yes stop_codon:yes gene_type:complete
MESFKGRFYAFYAKGNLVGCGQYLNITKEKEVL